MLIIYDSYYSYIPIWYKAVTTDHIFWVWSVRYTSLGVIIICIHVSCLHSEYINNYQKWGVVPLGPSRRSATRFYTIPGSIWIMFLLIIFFCFLILVGLWCRTSHQSSPMQMIPIFWCSQEKLLTVMRPTLLWLEKKSTAAYLKAKIHLGML